MTKHRLAGGVGSISSLFLWWLLLLLPGITWSGELCESKLREAVTKAIRDDGYTRALTIRRNDAREFPVYTSGARKLVFYEIQEGGIDTDETGHSSLSIVDHPANWRVFVDPDSTRVYRIFGFKSGTEYSDLARSLGITLSPQRAQWLAEGFVELAYAKRAAVLHNAFEARRFMEDELYIGLEPKELRSYMRKWLRRWGRKLEGVRPPEVGAVAGGFAVKLTVARTATKIGSRPKVEIRQLAIDVTRDGAATVIDDELTFSAEAPEEGE